MSLADWRPLVRPGDGLALLLCAALSVALALRFWSPDAPRQAIIRAGGQHIASLPLDGPRQLAVSGPLGTTHIQIEAGRARIISDPGPRQYCVKQGWLSRAGAIAICAPNEVSLSLEGRSSQFDTLNY